jgi:hypothetical protein
MKNIYPKVCKGRFDLMFYLPIGTLVGWVYELGGIFNIVMDEITQVSHKFIQSQITSIPPLYISHQKIYLLP